MRFVWPVAGGFARCWGLSCVADQDVPTSIDCFSRVTKCPAQSPIGDTLCASSHQRVVGGATTVVVVETTGVAVVGFGVWNRIRFV